MEQENQKNYDRKKFAALTKLAMAYRKPSEFAKHLQIPQKYLEVLLNDSCAAPPKLEVIKRIAKESLGRVSVEELAAAAGYGLSSKHPERELLSAQFGTWETVNGRLMNQGALKEYLRRMMKTMGPKEFAARAEIPEKKIRCFLADGYPSLQEANQLFERFGNEDMDYEDFISAAGHRCSQYHMDLYRNLDPDKIEIPEGFLDKQDADKAEKPSGQKKPEPELSQQPNVEITPYDFAELAILRYARKQGDAFFIEGSSLDRLVIRKESGERLLFNFRLLQDGLSETDILAVYKECAIMAPEAYGKHYLVFTDADTFQCLGSTPMLNLRARPSALLVSGSRIIQEEEL